MKWKFYYTSSIIPLFLFYPALELSLVSIRRIGKNEIDFDRPRVTWLPFHRHSGSLLSTAVDSLDLPKCFKEARSASTCLSCSGWTWTPLPAMSPSTRNSLALCTSEQVDIGIWRWSNIMLTLRRHHQVLRRKNSWPWNRCRSGPTSVTMSWTGGFHEEAWDTVGRQNQIRSDDSIYSRPPDERV